MTTATLTQPLPRAARRPWRKAEPLYTMAEAARIVGIPYDTVAMWRRRGVLGPTPGHRKLTRGSAVAAYTHDDLMLLGLARELRRCLHRSLVYRTIRSMARELRADVVPRTGAIEVNLLTGAAAPLSMDLDDASALPLWLLPLHRPVALFPLEQIAARLRRWVT